MWHLPKLDDTLVTITFQPHMLSCSIIKPSSHASPLQLHAYQEIPLHNLELEQLKIFNVRALQQHISAFFTTHNTHNAYVACTLNGPGIFERFILIDKAEPTLDDFMLPNKRHYVWEYRYVYPVDHGRWMFYVVGIKKELLLQYQLFAIAAQINMTTITTPRAALLALYKFQQGSAFRTGKLAIDMLHHHNMPEELFSPDALNRILSIPTSLTHHRTQAFPQLLNACGLYIAERITL